MRIKMFWKVSALLLFASLPVEAKTIYYGNTVELVQISYGGPTIFKFDKRVRTISQASRFKIKPANESDPDYSILAVTPRFMKGQNQVVFLLEDGRSVKLKVVSNSGKKKSPSNYDFVPKTSLIAKSDKQAEESDVTALDLLKGMIRGDYVAGYKVRYPSRKLNAGWTSLGVVLKKVYSGGKFNGYVYEIKNNYWTKLFTFDVRALKLGSPNLAIISQIDRRTLFPRREGKDKTLLRVVTKTTANPSHIHLPVKTEKVKGKSK